MTSSQLPLASSGEDNFQERGTFDSRGHVQDIDALRACLFTLKGNMVSKKQTKLAGYCFSTIWSLSPVRLFATPWACSNSCPIESVMPSNHLILCRPFLLPHSIFPSIMIFSSESNSAHQVARVLELQLQHQSFQ